MHVKLISTFLLGLFLQLSWANVSSSETTGLTNQAVYNNVTGELGEEILDFWDFNIQEHESSEIKSTKTNNKKGTPLPLALEDFLKIEKGPSYANQEDKNKVQQIEKFLQEVEFLIDNFETHKRVDPKLAAFLNFEEYKVKKETNPYRYMLIGEEPGEEIISEEEPISEEEDTPRSSVKIAGFIRYNLTREEFNNQGGIVKFITDTSSYLGISPALIRVLSIREGSTIVDFEIYSQSGTPEEANQQLRDIIEKLDRGVQDGSMDIYGVGILEYHRDVYLDTTASSEKDDGSGPGLAIGLVVGLVAFTVVIVAVFVYQRKNARRLARERLNKKHDLTNQV